MASIVEIKRNLAILFLNFENFGACEEFDTVLTASRDLLSQRWRAFFRCDGSAAADGRHRGLGGERGWPGAVRGSAGRHFALCAGQPEGALDAGSPGAGRSFFGGMRPRVRLRWAPCVGEQARAGGVSAAPKPMAGCGENRPRGGGGRIESGAGGRCARRPGGRRRWRARAR